MNNRDLAEEIVEALLAAGSVPRPIGWPTARQVAFQAGHRATIQVFDRYQLVYCVEKTLNEKRKGPCL